MRIPVVSGSVDLGAVDTGKSRVQQPTRPLEMFSGAFVDVVVFTTSVAADLEF